MVSGIDHADCVARAQSTKGADGSCPDGFEDKPALNSPVPLENTHIEALLEGFPDGHRHAGTGDHANRIVTVVRTYGLAVNGRGHTTEQGKNRNAIGARDLPQTTLGEAAREDRLNPLAQSAHERHCL